MSDDASKATVAVYKQDCMKLLEEKLQAMKLDLSRNIDESAAYSSPTGTRSLTMRRSIGRRLPLRLQKRRLKRRLVWS